MNKYHSVMITIGEQEYRASLCGRDVMKLIPVLSKFKNYRGTLIADLPVELQRLDQKVILAALRRYHPAVTVGQLEELDFAALDGIAVEVLKMISALSRDGKKRHSKRILEGAPRGSA